MEYHACDICEAILKEEYYVLGVTQGTVSTPQDSYKAVTIEDVFGAINSEYNRSKQKLVVKEICPACYQILQKLFKMRIQERKKLEKELRKLEKELEE